MITITVKDCNYISKDIYESVINFLPFHRLKCSCGHHGCLTIHGYYSRFVKNPDGKTLLRICRVKCSECGTTHALLLSSMVPYSQIPLAVQQEIILLYEQGVILHNVCPDNPDVDENNVKSILRSYRRHWKEKLLAEKILLTPLRELVHRCFLFYSAQFMQIHRTVNILFFSPT